MTDSRPLNVELNFRIFMRVLALCAGKPAQRVEDAFYAVMGDYTGKDSVYGKLDYVTDLFDCSYGEMKEIDKILGY
jgi:hypothetical protein